MGNVTTKAKLHYYKETDRFIVEIGGANASPYVFLNAVGKDLRYGERCLDDAVTYGDEKTILEVYVTDESWKSKTYEFDSRDITLNVSIEAGILFGKADCLYDDDTPNLLELADLLKGDLSLELIFAETEKELKGRSTSPSADSWFPKKYSHLCWPDTFSDKKNRVDIKCTEYHLYDIYTYMAELVKSRDASKEKESYYTRWTEFVSKQGAKIFQEEFRKELQKSRQEERERRRQEEREQRERERGIGEEIDDEIYDEMEVDDIVEEKVKEVPTVTTYCALAEIRVKQSTFCYIVISDTEVLSANQVLKDLTNNKLNFDLFISGLDCSVNVDSIDCVVLKDTLKIPGQVTIKDILGEVDETVMPIFLQE